MDLRGKGASACPVPLRYPRRNQVGPEIWCFATLRDDSRMPASIGRFGGFKGKDLWRMVSGIAGALERGVSPGGIDEVAGAHLAGNNTYINCQ